MAKAWQLVPNLENRTQTVGAAVVMVQGTVGSFMERQRAKDAALCTEVMSEIDQYVERYDVRGLDRLAEAASDVCDGWVTRREINALVCGRRLSLVGKPRGVDAVCGAPWSYWTVCLSEREIRARYPDRLSVKQVTKAGKTGQRARH